MTTKSTVLISVQLLCIVTLVITGPILPSALLPLVLASAGLGIILWAVVVMRLDNLRIQPDLPEHARLVVSGPYRWIRHPMYTGGTLIAIAWVWDTYSIWRLIAALVLLADFVVKMRYEERLLQARFPEYANYMTKTKRIIPYLY